MGLATILAVHDCRPLNYLHLEKRPPMSEAIGLIVKGKKLARAGQVDEAVSSFWEACELVPSLGIDPEYDVYQLAPSVSEM